jgi:hypothetical protein
MSFNKRARSTSASAATDRPAEKRVRTVEPESSSLGCSKVSGWHTLNNLADRSAPHSENPESVHIEAADNTPANIAVDDTLAAENSTKSRKPIAECFTTWDPPASLIMLPPIQATWGIKPFPSDPAGPQPHPTSPAARTSNAATNPPLWEDRKFPFVSGRYHKSFGPGPAPTDPAAPDLDQEDNFVLRLIDMRHMRSGPNKGAPRRQPITWHLQNGKPKDWTDVKQTLHAMNTRRRDNIRAITCDVPWTAYERQYLAELFRDHPNGSITELAERHNYLFTNNFRDGPLEEIHDVAFHQATAELSTGRTTESFRHEYLTWKHVYDAGDIPNPARDETHKKSNTIVQTHLDAFERDWDPAFDTAAPGYPVGYVPQETPSQKKATRAQKAKDAREKKALPRGAFRPRFTPCKKALSNMIVVNSSSDGNSDAPVRAPRHRPSRLSFSSASSLSDAPSSLGRAPSPHYRFIRSPYGSPHGLADELAEELLDLAGYNNPDEVRSSPPYVFPSRSPSTVEPSSVQENVED